MFVDVYFVQNIVLSPLKNNISCKYCNKLEGKILIPHVIDKRLGFK
jgi:hypothetical protein